MRDQNRGKTQVSERSACFLPENPIYEKNQKKGLECENLALKYFQNKNFRLIARRFKISGVEIDLLFRKKKQSSFFLKFQKLVYQDFLNKRFSKQEVSCVPDNKAMDHQDQWLIVEVKSLRCKDEIYFRLNFKQRQRLRRARKAFENKTSCPVELRVAYVLPSGHIIDLSLEDHL